MKSFKDLSEQHAEEGRFKPVKPQNVASKPLTSPRDKSDSATVKLKEDSDVCQSCQHDPCICDDSHGFVSEARASTSSFRASNAKRAQLNAMSPEERKAHDAKRAEQQRKRDDARLQKERERNSMKEHIEEGVVGTVKKVWKAISDFDSMRPKYDGNTRRRQEQRKRLEAKKPVREGYNDYHNNRTGFAKREREDDEYHNGPDPVKHTFTHTVSKEGGEKHQRTVTTGLTTRPKHEFEHMAKQHLEKQGYTIHEETKPSKEEKPPFDGPYKKKSSATPGKYGSGYSTARHLARQAMSKFSKPVKEESEYSRKAQIVKNAKKSKKTDDKFEPEPELGTSVVKADN